PSGWWQTYSRFGAPEWQVTAVWNEGLGDYGNYVLDSAHAAGGEGALRELLNICRREGITTTMVTMPECSGCRSHYSPHDCEAVDGLLTRLSREYRVRWIDARTWVTDTDFLDSQHHLLRHGAEVFSARLGREL